MLKKIMFSLLLVAFIVVGFGFTGLLKVSAQTVQGYGYSYPVCGYGGCSGYNYSVAMYPYTEPTYQNTPALPSYAYITGCGENGCNQGWGTPSYQSAYQPPVYYNPRTVYPTYSTYQNSYQSYQNPYQSIW
jgi:hypothetical protein